MYTLVLGIHRYINTLSISSGGVCVCVQTGRGHLFYDATRYLLHILIDCSIVFVSLSRLVDDCKGRKKKNWQKIQFLN